MGIKFISVKCPDCGATLDVEEGRKQLYCSYCGASVLVFNENEHVVRHVDEAEIKKVEAEQMVQLKKLELIEKKRIAAEKRKKTKIVISVILGIISIASSTIGFSGLPSLSFVGLLCFLGILAMWANEINKNEIDDVYYALPNEKISFPSSAMNYYGKDYKTIERTLKRAGFTRVVCIPLYDLRVGWLKKDSAVESIRIDGHSAPSSGTKYSPNALIEISFHCYK